VPHMVLDGSTLLNLELLENSYDSSRKGTLLGVLDECTTPFGKRRFKHWLCAPLLRPADINDRCACDPAGRAGTRRASLLASPPPYLRLDVVARRRLDAVTQLMPLVPSAIEEARKALRNMPDLERLLARIHGLGSRVAAADHPDARAVMYEGAVYSRRKIGDLLAVLKAFNVVAKVRAVFHAASTGGLLDGLDAPMLRRVLHDDFPALDPLLKFFSTAFDAAQVRQGGGRGGGTTHVACPRPCAG